MTTILDEIFATKRQRVAEEKSNVDPLRLRDDARIVRHTSLPFALSAALNRRDRANIIAEFKRASPSRGLINGMSDPRTTALGYELGGACAISVLTEEDHFRGSLADLRSIREVTRLPILRKDFIFDEFQIYQAAAAGADAILLIVAMLDSEQLARLKTAAEDLGLDALIEVHSSDEMAIARSIGAKLIGVNNRNLKTFDVSLDVSRELADLAPPEALLVTESGLKTREDLIELRALGYSGFLIGETLMRSGDPASELRALMGEAVV